MSERIKGGTRRRRPVWTQSRWSHCQLISPEVSYDWGTGYFKDIAEIRRRVYTTYYTLTEHRAQLQEVLGLVPDAHLRASLDMIEGKDFQIDSKRYEEIKAALWRRAKEEFSREIANWEMRKDQVLVAVAASQLQRFNPLLGTWCVGMPSFETFRAALLGSAALQLFDVLTPLDANRIHAEVEMMLTEEGTRQGINVRIDFIRELYTKVILRPGRLVIIVGDINSIACDLKLYAEGILRSWLKQLHIQSGFHSHAELFALARQQSIEVTIVANAQFAPRNNNHVRQYNATSKNVSDLLALPELSDLNRFREERLLKIEEFDSEYPGTVLTDVAGRAAEVILDAQAVIALGEQNNLTLNGLTIDTFRVAPIRDFGHIFYTGIKFDTDNYRYPHFAILFAPAGVCPAIDWAPDVPTQLSAAQFSALFTLLSPEQRVAVFDEARRVRNANVLTLALELPDLSERQKLELQEVVGPSPTRRAEVAKSVLKSAGGEYCDVIVPVSDSRSRVMHVLNFPLRDGGPVTRRLDLKIAFAAEENDAFGRPKTKLSWENLGQTCRSALVGFNFLYFITRNLLSYFNQSNPHFTLGVRFFGEFIDFLKVRIRGQELLYPPLYNKGAVGLRPDGSVVFGRVRMPACGAVTLPIGNTCRRFEWESVNPLSREKGENSGVAIFTPNSNAFIDRTRTAPHTFGETRRMYFTPQSDDYNFVMVNNKLLGVVRGSTEIPPFGTVLSVAPDAVSKSEQRTLEAESDALRATRKHVEEFRFVSFEFGLDPLWSGVDCILGGALLMADDGKMERFGGEGSVYDVEGWSLESSQRTQETPVETDLNEARTTIGTTKDDNLFVCIIEGRANNRTGATHQETMSWIGEYFERRGQSVRYALDLDSASSVALGVVMSGKFHLLNQTARGSDSKVGETRYANHVAYLRFR